MKTTTPSSQSVRSLISTGVAATGAYEILSLDDPLDVRASQRAHKPVFWVSKRPAPDAVGGLADDFQGAWYQPASICVKIGDAQTEHVLPETLTRRDTGLLKAVLEQHLKGAPPNRIQQHLADSAVEQFLI